MKCYSTFRLGKLVLIVTILVLKIFSSNATPESGRKTECEHYLSKSGKSCYPCQSGFYKVADCAENGHQADCAVCPTGTYQTDSCSQGEQCAFCSTGCPSHHMDIVENCTRTSDILCRCKDRYYWMKARFGDENEGMCLPHTQCKTGEGIYLNGTSFADSVCRPCIYGETFSDELSASKGCTTCTNCAIQGLDTIHECTRYSDSVCGTTDIPAVAVILGAGFGGFAFTIALCLLLSLYVRTFHRPVWIRIMQILIGKGYCPVGRVFWNRLFQRLTENIPWPNFSRFYRYLMWKLADNESSRLSGDRIETIIQHKREDNLRNTQHAQYELLLEWKSMCRRCGKTPSIAWIRSAMEEAEIDMQILDRLVSEIRGQLDEEFGHEMVCLLDDV